MRDAEGKRLIVSNIDELVTVLQVVSRSLYLDRALSSNI